MRNVRAHIEAARTVYLDRLALGYPTADARREALAYLRRKTGWAESFAAGVLDRALEYPTA